MTPGKAAAEVWGGISARRAANMRVFVRDIRATRGLREVLPLERAVDTVWVTNSSEVYVLLTSDRGWSPMQFERWLIATRKRLLLP